MDEVIKPMQELFAYLAFERAFAGQEPEADEPIVPLGAEINVEQLEALKKERAEALDRIKDQSHGD